ncbi:glycosyltransferase family 61 protein [Halobaculum sp. P14]|uniref:glycosyltransferase family 61 protein n=1 Tax=Halobaculum sp. P14 TaxID=3421638 RepID=UPI003EB7E447
MSELLRYYAARSVDRVVGSGPATAAIGALAVTRDDHEEVAQRVWRFGDAEAFTFDDPISPDDPPEKMAQKLGRIRISRPFVAEFSDVQLVGPDAMALTGDGPLLENSVGSPEQFSLSVLRAATNGVLPVRRTAERRLDTVVSLVGPWTHGYYHWYSDYLLRLEGLRRYEAEFDVEPDVLVPPDMSTWMRQSLELAGVDEDRWRQWRGGRVDVDRLVVPSLRRETSLTADETGFVFSPEAYRWLATQITRRVSPDTDQRNRIFISREQADARRVTNRPALMEVLSERGFEKYVLEELSVEEQVQLFANAEYIVAPMGAGLTNMIYATDATVVTLYGSDINTCYTVLADALGFTNAFLLCEPDGLDMRVDLDKLESLLNRLESEHHC